MATRSLHLCLLLSTAIGCDAKVVDAVHDPLPVAGGSGGSASSGGDAAAPDAGGSEPSGPQRSPLETSLLHRYSFDGMGALAIDSRGAAHGQLVGAKLSGRGSVTLAGERTGQYVNLPNGLISGLRNATFEVWLTWQGGAIWQRIFDFGNGTGGEDPTAKANGTTYLFLTASAGTDAERMLIPALHVAYSQNGIEDEDKCSGDEPLPSGKPVHVAVVVDHDAETFSLYQDGALLRSCALARPLSGIEDVNDWLGHSNFTADADLGGTYDEFRVYSAALSAEQIASSYAAGPDAGR